MWAGAALGLVGLHLAALYWPVVAVAGPVEWSDKVVHVLIFAVPTFVVGWWLRRPELVVLGFALHAPVSEIIQAQALPGRSGDWVDVLCDLAGVALAALALGRIRRARPVE